MSTKDELRNLANDCTGLFSTFVPKQILREAADELDTKQSRIDRLEKELVEAWKDAERMRVGAIIKALEIVNCEYDKNQAAQDIYVSTRERLIQEMGKS